MAIINVYRQRAVWRMNTIEWVICTHAVCKMIVNVCKFRFPYLLNWNDSVIPQLHGIFRVTYSEVNKACIPQQSSRLGYTSLLPQLASETSVHVSMQHPEGQTLSTLHPSQMSCWFTHRLLLPMLHY